MTEERVSPLRQRMIEDMRIRGMGDKARKSHIRAIKELASPLREPCPFCGGTMRVIEIFRRVQKPRSRAPPKDQAA